MSRGSHGSNSHSDALVARRLVNEPCSLYLNHIVVVGQRACGIYILLVDNQ